MLFADDVRRSWNQVIKFEGSDAGKRSTVGGKAANSFVEEDPDAFSLEPGARLIKDERGVRLAREEDND
jgi:hypothetical protein